MSIIILIMRRSFISTTAAFLALLSSAALTAGQNAAPSGDSDKSLGDIARKVRPKDAKVTSQRVFTDDDVQHSNSQNDAAPAKGPTLAESLAKARTAIEDKEGQTERQYAESVVLDIQFPERTDWEHRLYAQELKLIAASHAVLDAITANAPDAVIRSAKSEFDSEMFLRDRLKAEGIAKAAAWRRNR